MYFKNTLYKCLLLVNPSFIYDMTLNEIDSFFFAFSPNLLKFGKPGSSEAEGLNVKISHPRRMDKFHSNFALQLFCISSPSIR